MTRVPSSMLPQFLIIGAAKSATTWCARTLGRHPDVFVYAAEIHYFSRHHERPPGWYESHFDGVPEGRVVGEKSNSYLCDPEVPRRIADLLPDVRLLAILRDPVERAYSGYCMQLRNGKVSRDIGEYLDPENTRRSDAAGFLLQGFYARHLNWYGRYFDGPQLQVMLYDDLVADRARFVLDALRFLDLDESRMPVVESEWANRRRDREYPRPLSHSLSALRRSALGRRLLGAMAACRPGAWLARSMRTRRVRYPPMTEDLRRRLREHYRWDIMELESLIGRDLSHWRE